MSVDCPTGPLPVMPSLTRRGAADPGARAGGTARGRSAERAGGPSRAEEFTAFVEDRYDRLLRLASLLAGDRHRGEELLQASLVRTYEAFGRIQDTSRLDAYVRTVMVNSLRSKWRRKWREESFADVPERSSEDTAGRLAVTDQLRRALLRLPPKQRAALILRYYDDVSEAEAARILGCSVGTIKSQTSRALTHMRAVVNDDTGEIEVVR